MLSGGSMSGVGTGLRSRGALMTLLHFLGRSSRFDGIAGLLMPGIVAFLGESLKGFEFPNHFTLHG